jgi:hypothetical protein
MATLVAAMVGGCVEDPTTSDSEANLETDRFHLVFYEKFDNLVSGNIDGQNGWVGNCVVVDDAVPPNKYLKCRSGNNATKATNGSQTAGNYYLQADVWPNVNVVNSTHGKLSLEGPQGRVFQIIVGCDNIRVAFQMNGPVAPLLSFPCSASATTPPRYRVICTWSTSDDVLRCGAAPVDEEVTDWVDLTVPAPFRPFDRVYVSTFELPGATLFDKIYLERN